MLQFEDRCPYHSQWDTIDHVPAGNLQANGANMLALAHQIADDEALLRMRTTIAAKPGLLAQSDRAVTFDFLSIGWLVVYSWPSAYCLHTSISILALAVVAQQIWSEYQTSVANSGEGNELMPSTLLRKATRNNAVGL